ncbi:hypothetical protein BDQ17DRAFT_1376809, partial [Cyathus striatus]
LSSACGGSVASLVQAGVKGGLRVEGRRRRYRVDLGLPGWTWVPSLATNMHCSVARTIAMRVVVIVPCENCRACNVDQVGAEGGGGSKSRMVHEKYVDVGSIQRGGLMVAEAYYVRKAPFVLHRIDAFILPRLMKEPRDSVYSLQNRFSYRLRLLSLPSGLGLRSEARLNVDCP